MEKINIGKLDIIKGPMFSGKTSELFKRVRRFEVSGETVLIVKYVFDTRFSNTDACSHNKEKMKAYPEERILNVPSELIESASVIAIDEGQFFHDLVEACEFLRRKGKRVIVSVLSGDFHQNPFENVSKLESKATDIVFLKNICVVCKKSGAYSKKISFEPEGQEKLEDIGGEEKYLASCQNCFELDREIFIKMSQDVKKIKSN